MLRKRIYVSVLFINLLFFAFIANVDAAENNLSFIPGAEERFRVEYRDNFTFNKQTDDEGYLAFQRLLINGKLTYKQDLILFIEGNDIREISCNTKKTSQYDDLDLYQGYMEYKNGLIGIKIGRQQLDYGDKRLLAAPSWSNKLKSFDAIKTYLCCENTSLDLFTGHIVLYDDNNPNEMDNSEYVYGSHISYKNKNLFIPNIEFMYLTIYDEDKVIKGEDNRYGELNQHTIDTLIKGSLFSSGIDYAFEFAYQFGKYGTNDIKNAYAIHADIARKFNCFLLPELKLEYNNASGDKSPSDFKTNTFIPYYQTTHDPYGLMDFFIWQNMREIALSVKLNPNKKVSMTPALNFFWLDEKRDSWYKSSGSKIRTASNSDVSYFVGIETSVVIKYNLNKNVKLETGYAHFFSSIYVKDTGAHADVNWMYVQTKINF